MQGATWAGKCEVAEDLGLEEPEHLVPPAFGPDVAGIVLDVPDEPGLISAHQEK